METVEKRLKPLILLPLGHGTNCGIMANTSTWAVEFCPSIYIFAFVAPDSCLIAMYIVHIFLQNGVILVTSLIAMIRPKWIHPQTHRLWITLAVEEEISTKCAFEAFWEKFMHRFSTRIGILLCQNESVYMSEYGRHQEDDKQRKSQHARLLFPACVFV